MMIKLKTSFLILLVVLLSAVSCKKDDGGLPPPPPPRDRGPEALRAQEEIEGFLKTHFYNYDEFLANPDHFQIRFDSIAGENANKIPLIDQVISKEVKDLIDPSVTYKLYYLVVREGQGDKPHFSDNTINTYEGRSLNLNLFDSSVQPVKFNLVDGRNTQGIIRGLQQALIEFRGADDVQSNPDGTLTFKNFGIGAVFIPSGLAYYQYGSRTILPYEQLIFAFELFDSEIADHDGDGIPSYMEDLNNNGYLGDDDTDGDGIPNYLDDDDDGDGRLTKDEIIIHEDGTLEFPDKNGNGIPDYLDPTI